MALSLELLQKSRVWIFVWSKFHTKSGVNSTKKKTNSCKNGTLLGFKRSEA